MAINIDPKNKGKFTAKAKAKGKGVQEYASQVMANKENYSPATVKQANFARNAAKWNEGGNVDLNDPTNRDTVPAMLTPGEFVLNKEATALFGPQIEAMNEAGLQQRRAENELVKANIGKKISKLHGEGYTAPGQAFAIAKSMGYNTGGLVGFLKEHEGYRDKAYQDQAGVWTIGYGRTTNPDGSPISPGQTTNQEKEDKWLDKRAAADRAATEKFAEKHGYDWDDQQMDALASFRYNIGNLDQLTAGGTRTTDQIAEYLPKYNKAGGKVSEGLVNRRQAELDIFNRNREQSEVPPTEAPPHAQETVVAEAPVPVPGGDEPAGGSFFGGDLANLATSFWQPQAPIPIQGQQLQQVNPEYIPSVARRGDRRRNRNEGGPVEYLNVGGQSRRGRRRKEKGGPATAEQLGPNYTSAYSGGGRNAPRGPLQPAGPENDRTLNPLPPGRDPNINRFGQELGRLSGQAQLKVGPQESGQVPAIDDLPPVPATDEALLQNSSQAVEAEETNKQDAAKIMQEIQKLSPDEQEAALNALSPEMQEAVLDVETQAYQTNEALQTAQLQAAVTAPDAPGAQFAQDRVDALSENLTGLGVPPESQGVGADVNVGGFDAPPLLDQRPPELQGVEQAGGVPGIDTQAPEAPKPKMTPNEKNEAAATLVTDTLKEQNAPPSEQIEAAGPDNIAASGEAKLAANPKAGDKIKSQIKGAFGDLIDGPELARMAVLFLGARATGASPGQALAYAGQQYLGRLDAKANRFDSLASSGKYTKQSLKEYKESGDITTLTPVGVAPTRTGNFVTRYDKRGKPVQLEEVKVGDNTLLQDAQGNVRSGFDFAADPSEVRGSPEYRTRIKQSTGQIETQLNEMRKAFDTFQTADGEGSKTDILPSTNSSKIAEWAVDNGVSPDELGGLVESAYHDALNDRRQDGGRARNLVPYLQQLVVRKSVGGNAEVFHAKGQSGDGPPQYVNPKKLQKLNAAAGSVLKNMGHQGTVNDLSNIFYTEALKDWNGLDADTKKQWGRKALKDESGFYLFAQDLLLGAK